MALSIAETSSELERMASLLTHAVKLASQLNSFNDGPHLREQISSDVRSLSTASQNVKQSLTQLKNDGTPGVDPLIARFEALRTRMQDQLPPIAQKVRGSPLDSSGGAGGGYTEPLLTQAQVDGDTDLLDNLELQIRGILAMMREVSQLFGQTLQELQKQRHLLQAIEGETARAVEEMEEGNEALQTAQEHQKSSTKCICWIVIIVTLVVVAVALIIVWRVVWSKKPEPTGTVSPSAEPEPEPQFW
jgi:hypothetical protein